MTDNIKHKGVVETIEGNHIRVKILQVSACAACHAKDLCNSSDNKEKIVDVYTDHPSEYTAGDDVYVLVSQSTGRTAVLWGFIIPFLFLMTFLILGYTLSGSEGIGALSAIGGLALYYLLLSMKKQTMARKFTFTIKPQ